MANDITTTKTEDAVRRITGLIRERQFSPASRLPSERELEQQWQMSRGTVNRAVACMIAQGHLRRVGYKLYPTGVTPGEAIATPALAPIHVLEPPYSAVTSLGLLEAAHDVARTMRTHTIPVISETASEQCEQLSGLLRNGTEGFVLWPQVDAPVDNLLRQARAQGVPFVLCDLDLGAFDFVSVDNEQGTRIAVEHLHALGHRRMLYVTQPLRISSLRRRCDGYIQGCMAMGMRRASTAIMEVPSVAAEEVKGAFERYRAEFSSVTAVAFSNDLLAIQFMRLATEAGIRVPGELSVIGFDDLDVAEFTTPALTTVAQNFYQSGVVATQLLFRLMEDAKKGKRMPAYRLRVEPRLVVRGSTGAVANPTL